MDVARLNFSHGTHEEHGQRIELIRQESAALGKQVALLQDLCGPKIRTAKVGPRC
jgi:pyruvate kinase